MKSATSAAEQLSLPGALALVRRPSESAVSEGNVAELPIWVLNPRETKPQRNSDFVKTIDLGNVFDGGRPLSRTVKIKASPEYGFPSMFDYRVLVAIMKEGREAERERRRQTSGWSDATIPISRHRISRLLNYSRPGGRELQHVEDSCKRLLGTQLEFTGTWLDRPAKSRARSEITHLLWAVNLDPETQYSFQGIDGRTRSSVTLGPLLYKSLQDGYFNGVDLEYINALNKALPQRLYSYLTKQDGQNSNGSKRRSHTEGIQKLAAKFDLKKRSPSALYDALAPALDLLASPIQPDPHGPQRRFLENWSINSDRQQLSVEFYDETAADIRAKVDASLKEAVGKWNGPLSKGAWDR